MSKPLELPFLNLVRFCRCIGKRPPYSIVYPTLLDERSVGGKKVVALSQDITLNLAPTNVFSDNFVLSTARTTDILHSEFDTSEIRRTLYHDEARMAAVSMRDDGGVIEVRGVIGEILRIEPLPFLERRANGQIPHRLFHARNVNPNDKVTVSARALATATAARPSRVHLKHVVVEMFILCDTAFLEFFLTDAEMTDYLAITVAAVNLRYKSLQPTIKFSIVGILKLNDVVENIFMKTNGTYLDAQVTLLNFMRFTYGGGLREADVTYLVTGMDMAEFYRGKVYSQIAGLAYVATLCAYDGVAIGEDRGALYFGVDIMAHELAHSLGCVHDGDGPYQKTCRAQRINKA
uniref:Putative tick metalloprotease 1 n=1 Tax=Amblyomma cajennense TaxID=34607 RepID=A0A023FP79_AMBCJ